MVMIREITETMELGFDLVDDTCMHMRNDPNFYRKEYYPMACKMNSLKTEDLMPLVDSAFEQYHKKFSITSPIDQFFGEQEKAQNDFEEAQKIINTNYTGVVSILNIIVNDFEKHKKGFIVGISSVAGDRGRKSNFIYGSAKAAFTTYLSGLRNRLFKSNVHVMTVKPGFVATKMTEGLDLPTKLTAQTEEVAQDIFKAQQKGNNVIYTKWFWKYILLIIKNIPEFMFKKTSI